MSSDVIFDKLPMMHSKSDEDLGRIEDVTKYVEFESSTITNIIDQKQFEAPDESDRDL